MRHREAIRAAVAGLLLLAALGRGAAAHGLHVRTGDVVVEAQRVVAAIRVDLADVARLARLAPDGDAWSADALLAAARAMGDDVAAELAIRDASGLRLDAALREVTLDAPAGTRLDAAALHAAHATFRLDAPLPERPAHLTFRLETGAAPGPDLRQLVLAVRGADETEPHAVRLTSGGNAETVALAWKDAPLRAPSREGCGRGLQRGPEALTGVVAVLRRSHESAVIDVVIPLPLLETWLPVERERADVLTVAEQAAAREAVARLVASRVSLLANGALVQPGASRTDFVGLDEDVILVPPVGPPPRDLGALTTRARVRLEHRVPQDADLEVSWDLWNSVVLTAHATLAEGVRCLDQEISTYEPRLAWRRLLER